MKKIITIALSLLLYTGSFASAHAFHSYAHMNVHPLIHSYPYVAERDYREMHHHLRK